MKIIKTPLVLLCSLFLLAGCQYFQFPGVHKINIQQGHIITEEMISQLEPGMNKRQVRFVLGTPLINDIFNDDRWDYYYSLKMGDGRFFKRTLTVYFDGDTFTHFEGENLPEAEDEQTEDPEQEPDTPLPTNS
ncbi:outer membrane protein assembly factor BamE [Gilvimarinus algae]|uniref:Outer membrane protein assembly factor BamE n=1 Tax=Gilvimarinus algae TaxID=3058037 RepID=A0ABT8TIC8_9GAMM|nr:outer membrane protein assembly factor BamE [Gilvimarinus sp. SDUM040014]MDO3383790.1 outer membrane protein assembly factor BamE [Gilvimarinus sp. SDUM040014]